MRLQEFGPLCVTCGLRRVGMDASIHFDYELMLNTESIEDKMTVRMLPPELEPGQTTASQRLPQLFFSQSWLASLLAGHVNDPGCGFAACFSHTSPPVPSPDDGTEAVRRGGVSLTPLLPPLLKQAVSFQERGRG